jgi:hypothetical protein
MAAPAVDPVPVVAPVKPVLGSRTNPLKPATLLSNDLPDCNSPETCACEPTGQCETINAPYPEPPALCSIVFRYRLWVWNGFPTPFYHTFIVSHIALSGHGAASEVYDAVFANAGCPLHPCGAIFAFANPNKGFPYNGLDGDTSGGSSYWPGGNTGTSSSICENVGELQSWVATFGTVTPYFQFSQNSNSFTSSAAAAVWLTPPPPPMLSVQVPGWGTPVPY